MIIIKLDNEVDHLEINVQAEKSLYTYQIDAVNMQIMNRNAEQFDGISLSDSLGNTIVLETWLQQVNRKII